MKTYDIRVARTRLTRLIEQAARGRPFVIARAGKPMVKVVAPDAPISAPRRRFGFMAGEILVPDDFNTTGADSIASCREGVA